MPLVLKLPLKLQYSDRISSVGLIFAVGYWVWKKKKMASSDKSLYILAVSKAYFNEEGNN